MAIFDFLNKNGYSCEILNTHLHFGKNDILMPCCCTNAGPVFAENLSEKDSIKDFIKIKKTCINLLKKGRIKPKSLIAGCKGCISLKKYSKTNDFRIKRIILSHYTQCNCACIYCIQGNTKLSKIKEKAEGVYDVLKFINELYDNGLIDTENLEVEFHGGNISCLENHSMIIRTLMHRGIHNITIFTNNIVYLPEAEDLLKIGKGMINVSLDSGTAETYKKLKQLDKFNIVVENLKKYINAAGNSGIIVKYIIVRYYNDNLEEMEKFLTLLKNINVKIVCIDIDLRDTALEFFKPPEHYYKIIDYAGHFCSSNGMDLFIPDYAQSILDKRFTEKSR